MTQLRPFDQHDWDAFSEIAYVEAADGEYGWCVILDDKHVQVVVGPAEDSYGADFPSAALARLVAEALLNDKLDIETIGKRAEELGLELL